PAAAPPSATATPGAGCAGRPPARARGSPAPHASAPRRARVDRRARCSVKLHHPRDHLRYDTEVEPGLSPSTSRRHALLEHAVLRVAAWPIEPFIAAFAAPALAAAADDLVARERALA